MIRPLSYRFKTGLLTGVPGPLATAKEAAE